MSLMEIHGHVDVVTAVNGVFIDFKTELTIVRNPLVVVVLQ